jgi:hypothetical protein
LNEKKTLLERKELMRTRLLRASEITTALETEKVTTKSKNLLVFNKKYFYFL